MPVFSLHIVYPFSQRRCTALTKIYIFHLFPHSSFTLLPLCWPPCSWSCSSLDSINIAVLHKFLGRHGFFPLQCSQDTATKLRGSRGPMACEKFNIKSHKLILGRFFHAANDPEPVTPSPDENTISLIEHVMVVHSCEVLGVGCWPGQGRSRAKTRRSN